MTIEQVLEEQKKLQKTSENLLKEYESLQTYYPDVKENSIKFLTKKIEERKIIIDALEWRIKNE